MCSINTSWKINEKGRTYKWKGFDTNFVSTSKWFISSAIIFISSFIMLALNWASVPFGCFWSILYVILLCCREAKVFIANFQVHAGSRASVRFLLSFQYLGTDVKSPLFWHLPWSIWCLSHKYLTYTTALYITSRLLYLSPFFQNSRWEIIHNSSLSGE